VKGIEQQSLLYDTPSSPNDGNLCLPMDTAIEIDGFKNSSGPLVARQVRCVSNSRTSAPLATLIGSNETGLTGLIVTAKSEFSQEDNPT
jgi:hypothetical protein